MPRESAVHHLAVVFLWSQCSPGVTSCWALLAPSRRCRSGRCSLSQIALPTWGMASALPLELWLIIACAFVLLRTVSGS
jgi:hypothetical protein